ncbi:unnamed protein product [Owenia fusiformis]|uniref:J domain-containing protein n=1 Tax=Owenia fusiformis TaxID=6347 RepID=A0A8S4PVG9_OWEFU|nr:unnamed protein product [Owenia fusiformis]
MFIKMAIKDHFKTLEIPRSCNEDDVKKAYRTLAKKYHPDKNDASNAEEKFKEIGAAYEILKSKDRREIYLRSLQRQEDEERQPKSSQSNSNTTSWRSEHSSNQSNGSKNNTSTGASSGGTTGQTGSSSKGTQNKSNESQSKHKANKSKTSANEGTPYTKQGKTEKSHTTRKTSGRKPTNPFSTSYEHGQNNEKRKPPSFQQKRSFSSTIYDSDDDDSFETMFDLGDILNRGKYGRTKFGDKLKQSPRRMSNAERPEWDNSWNESKPDDMFDSMFDDFKGARFMNDGKQTFYTHSYYNRKNGKPTFTNEDKEYYDWNCETEGDTTDETLYDSLGMCMFCKRTFDPDIILKHQRVCARLGKSRLARDSFDEEPDLTSRGTYSSGEQNSTRGVQDLPLHQLQGPIALRPPHLCGVRRILEVILVQFQMKAFSQDPGLRAVRRHRLSTWSSHLKEGTELRS